jgi:hypothetical protein
MSDLDGQTFMPLPHSFMDAVVKAAVAGVTAYLVSMAPQPVGYAGNMTVRLFDNMIPMSTAAAATAATGSLVADGIHWAVNGPWDRHKHVANALVIAGEGALLPGLIFASNPSMISLQGSPQSLSALKLWGVGSASAFGSLVIDNTRKQWGLMV